MNPGSNCRLKPTAHMTHDAKFLALEKDQVKTHSNMWKQFMYVKIILKTRTPKQTGNDAKFRLSFHQSKIINFFLNSSHEIISFKQAIN